MKKGLNIGLVWVLILGIATLFLLGHKPVEKHSNKATLVYSVSQDIASPAETQVLNATRVIASGFNTLGFWSSEIGIKYVNLNQYYCPQHFYKAIKWLVEYPIFIQICCLRL